MGELNAVLQGITTDLGILQGRDGGINVLHANLNLNGHRLINVARSVADTDALTRGEAVSNGLFRRNAGDAHIATAPIVAQSGIKVPVAVVGTDAVPLSQAQGTFLGAGGGTVAAFGLSQTTATALTANANDYTPVGGAAFRMSATIPVNVTGFAARSDGSIVLLVNVGANAITLTHEDIASVAANRFHFPAALNVVLATDAAILLWYDTPSSRWRDIAKV